MDNYFKIEISDAALGMVRYYDEADLLKDYSVDSINGEVDELVTLERYNAVNTFNGHWIGYCFNSMPPFVRAQKYKEGRWSWMHNLNYDSIGLYRNDDGTRKIDARCPKVAWGFTAFLVSHAGFDSRGRLICYASPGKQITLNGLMEQYLSSQKRIYEMLHRGDYEYYRINGIVDEIECLDSSFLRDHYDSECNLYERTEKSESVGIITAFLKISEGYLNFLMDKEQDERVRIIGNKVLNPHFRDVIIYRDKRKLIKRLHELIDEARLCDIGVVLLKCKLDGLIRRIPTEKEFKSEFNCNGSWEGVSKYTRDTYPDNINRANQIVILSDNSL